MTRRGRDRMMLFGALGLLLLGSVAYTVADAYGWIPDRLSARYYSARRGAPVIRPGEPGDPDLVLGVPVGDARFRLNWRDHTAMVMRPVDQGLEDWVIPSRFVYRDETFTVIALHSFALLYAPKVRRVSLPPTLEWLNEADTMAPQGTVIERRGE